MNKRFFYLPALLLLCSLFSSSCRDYNLATCQVVNNVTPFETGIPSYDGTLYSTNLYFFTKKNGDSYYTLGEIVSGGGKSAIYELPKDTEKVKVGFKFLGAESGLSNHPGNIRFYVLAYTFVERGQHYELEIHDNTFYSNKINYGSQEALSIEDVPDNFSIPEN